MSWIWNELSKITKSAILTTYCISIAAENILKTFWKVIDSAVGARIAKQPKTEKFDLEISQKMHSQFLWAFSEGTKALKLLYLHAAVYDWRHITDDWLNFHATETCKYSRALLIDLYSICFYFHFGKQ